MLLLLSPCMYCEGRTWDEGVPGTLVGPSLSPVNNNLLNASTSKCGLFLLAVERDEESVVVRSSLTRFDAVP